MVTRSDAIEQLVVEAFSLFKKDSYKLGHLTMRGRLEHLYNACLEVQRCGYALELDQTPAEFIDRLMLECD
jgi:hypothetical protein